MYATFGNQSRDGNTQVPPRCVEYQAVDWFVKGGREKIGNEDEEDSQDGDNRGDPFRDGYSSQLSMGQVHCRLYA